jgi:hypothetical protein
MLLLTSTSDIVRIVTGSAGSIHVHASWVDNASGTITPGRTNTAAITTATTTTIVAAPAASTQRNVKHLNITNNSGSVSNVVVVQHFDGTNSEDLMGVTLLPGENLIFNAEGTWHHHDAQGAEYGYTVPTPPNLGLTGTLSETIPRELCPEVNTAVGATGVLFMQAIKLTAGQVINNIIASSATTAAGTPTNYAFGIYDSARNLLANTANQTTTAWAANTVKTIALTAAFRVPTTGVYYIGFYMTATTVLTLKGGTAKTGGQLAAAAPILNGTSSTGLTTTLPNPAAAITAGTASIYAAVT